MAGFLDKVEKLAKDGMAKGTELVEEGKDKAAILGKERNIKEAMLKIGEYYYDKGEADSEVANYFEEIAKAKAEIEELKK